MDSISFKIAKLGFVYDNLEVDTMVCKHLIQETMKNTMSQKLSICYVSTRSLIVSNHGNLCRTSKRNYRSLGAVKQKVINEIAKRHDLRRHLSQRS